MNTPGSSSLPVLAAEAGVRLVDYYSREELSVYNSVPTAEGAIAIAMNELPVTISGCSAQVIGYGRVGRTLAAALRGLGASVTVYARREADIAWAGVRGCIARRTAELAVGETHPRRRLPRCRIARRALSSYRPRAAVQGGA